MYSRILVPTDGSELSEQTARTAVDFARMCNAEVIAFAVAEPYPQIPAAEGAMVIDPGVETETLMASARQNVEKVAQMARTAGVPCRSDVTLSMVPAAQEIIEAAAKYQCDLIFMASHGRRGLSRLLAGSVTQRVLTESSVPVMVLRPGRQDRKHRAAGTEAAAAS